VYVREVEKAVALWRGRALLSLAWGEGVGGGTRGYVNGAAVLAAEGFEWRGELQAARSFTEPPARKHRGGEERRIQASSGPCEPNTTLRRPLCPPSLHPPLLHSSTPSPLLSQIGKINK